MGLNTAKELERAERDRRGFTLVELMAVLAVLAIITAIAVPRFTTTIKTAKEKADEASALIIARAAEQLWFNEGKSSEATYNENDLVGEYIREIKWQASDEEGVTVVVNVKGECTGVYYGNKTGGKNLLTGKEDGQ